MPAAAAAAAMLARNWPEWQVRLAAAAAANKLAIKNC
jgi:hypothetical protein